MPADARKAWENLVLAVTTRHAGVERGKMMSADALLFYDGVFVFYSTKGGRIGLGARVGRESDLSAFALSDWQHLAPFKTKPPMKDWIVVGIEDLAQWGRVADFAYKKALERL